MEENTILSKESSLLDVQLVYHLVGEQGLPVYMTAIQFPVGSCHYLLTTDAQGPRSTAENIKRKLTEVGYKAEIRILGSKEKAVSFISLSEKIKDILEKTNPHKHSAVFDVTGGTKPMSMIGLLLASRVGNMPSIYLDNFNHQLININKPQETYPLVKRLKIQDFIALGNLTLGKYSEKAAKEEFLDFIFSYCHILQSYQEKFSKAGENKSSKDHFLKDYNNFLQKLAQKCPANRTRWIQYWDEFCNSDKKNWIEQAAFLAGGWFEHYTFVKQKKANPGLEQIFMGVTLNYPDGNLNAQELDVVYTDGFSLTILECKAGKVNQEHIQKLENLSARFAGALGQCALVALSPKCKNDQCVVKRVKQSRRIALFRGPAGIPKIFKECMSFLPGKIYE
ncbi:MAG: DUF1887 family protein [Lentisphaeria bacterium]|nr:DUF1887 family protein [Lentisphaeria bacterium]